MTPKDLFWRGLSGANSGGRFAPVRFCSLPKSFWGICLVSGRVPALAPPGAVPVVGGYLYPSVLRFSGATPQKCRAAHGPRHPAVSNPSETLSAPSPEAPSLKGPESPIFEAFKGHSWGLRSISLKAIRSVLKKVNSFRKVPDTFNFLRHVMRAFLSVRPKCSHRCVSLKETPLKPVQILKHITKNSAEQTVMRTKWFNLWIVLVFPRKNTRIHKNGRIHELFVVAISLVCRGNCKNRTLIKFIVLQNWPKNAIFFFL